MSAAARLPAGGSNTPPAMVALLVLLTLGCGAAAGALALAGDDAVRVVAAARALPAGTVISRADLRAADLSGNGLAAIPADRDAGLLGTTVLGPIPEGTLLNDGMVTKTPAPPDGSVAVGLALKPGQVPAQQLAPGRFVAIYLLPPADSGGGPAASVLVERAEVLSVAAGGGGDYQVTVVVNAGTAAAVSAAGAAEQVALGLLQVGG